MATGSPTTAVNVRLPRGLVEAVDIVLHSWQRQGFEGDRRDAIEALLSYVFSLHRGENDPRELPPVELCRMEFKERNGEIFDPSKYVSSTFDYDPAKWRIY